MLASAFLFSSMAQAAPSASVGAGLTASSAGPSASVAGRLGLDSGFQLGLLVQGQQVSTAFIDGWPVTDGTAVNAQIGATVPLVRAEPVRVDVEVVSGARSLWATETDAPDDRSLILIADVSPVATVALRDGLAARLGWVQLTHLQLQPGPGLDAQGSLVRGGLVIAPTDSLQLALDAQAGGVFGFDGDGGKFLAQAGAQLRWVPGAAATWTNH